ncbi:Undecaprenyl-phosphate 4-deoxy-4-formamido-L-arabinose transferase [Arenibacter antarcticus]|uniref:TIGR04283 family arsenosugar biosynthesis glycosyltransferase n=1 Tax=Arenibacter antarcticus TaxID=2040469 RepID=A0ABW5VHF8_9FLAO|nr:TIGR04283 family arsenosugar biosynthesis glycosyltransferase [Arenibacter sp. H213]MCM4166917.1 glycosyl transferase family 2 [Arenibacter sp. H213]
MKLNNHNSISIIIPVFNEATTIKMLLEYLRENSVTNAIKEIIVVDGGSTDQSFAIAKDFGATMLRAKKGRAKQMNIGAKHASGEILYFLHADTFPPKQFDQYILSAIETGFKAGCFRMRFNTSKKFLQFFAWFSRINHKLCRGGDQSLFVQKELFHKSKGYNEAYIIYEDTEFIGRLYRSAKFTVLPQHVITSARKYEQLGTVRLQYHFGVIHLKNILGFGPDQLYDYYKKNIAN